MTTKSDAVQTTWNEAYAKIAANDSSTKKDQWLKQLSEQDVTFGTINKDIADSYKKGGLLAERRTELETSLDNVNKQSRILLTSRRQVIILLSQPITWLSTTLS